MSTRPVVTVAIPTLDEAGAIGECLDRVSGQTWTALDIVVADGGSSDGTQALVQAHALADPRIRLIDNPGRLQSAGLNRVLAESAAELVVRLDARSFVDADYVERCATMLLGSDHAVVGGRMVPRPGETRSARGIALANRSWWGAGPARFHRGGTAGPADTVYLGAFRRAWLERVGGWAEDVGVNEDYELNLRIREAGGVIWLDPTLEVGYQARTTFRALGRQYFRYGASKAAVLRRHPRSVRARQLAPAGLALVGIAALAPGVLGWVARSALVAHIGAVALGAATAARSGTDGALAAGAAVTMHWSWSLGLWGGLLRPGHRYVR